MRKCIMVKVGKPKNRRRTKIGGQNEKVGICNMHHWLRGDGRPWEWYWSKWCWMSFLNHTRNQWLSCATLNKLTDAWDCIIISSKLINVWIVCLTEIIDFNLLCRSWFRRDGCWDSFCCCFWCCDRVYGEWTTAAACSSCLCNRLSIRVKNWLIRSVFRRNC